MPSPEVVQRALSEIGKRTANYRYFFDQLKSPSWIEPLLENGFFQSPPPPIVEGESISFPFWPESRYLARMAPLAAEIVLRVALQMPETENVRVHEDLAEAACGLPPEMAGSWATRESTWVKSQNHLYLILPSSLGRLVSHLARGGQSDAALELARRLLSIAANQGDSTEGVEDKVAGLVRRPRARFSDWTYGEILRLNVPDLLDAAPERTFSLLCDLLEEAIQVMREDEEDEKGHDYSFIWRPAIEEHEQNSPGGRLEDLLVSAVRDAAERVASRDSSRVPKLVETLEGKGWLVFRRLALHLLRAFPDEAPSLMQDRLTDRSSFDDPGLRHEYNLLLRAAFSRLSPEAQNIILGWISQGPDIESFKLRTKERPGREPSDEEIQIYTKSWRRDRLAPMSGDLSSEWLDVYNELVSELGGPEHPDFLAFRMTSWQGSTSPKLSEELRAMSVDELTEYLRTWRPSAGPREPSTEGLAKELTQLVASQPDLMATEAQRFEGLDPTYVRALLMGLREAAPHTAFNWAPVLQLCSWVVGQPGDTSRRSADRGLEPRWDWARHSVLDLLHVGFETGPAEISFEHRPVTWQILRPLTEDPDPTPEHEAEYGGSNWDPLTMSLNTTRGKAMHAVLMYAFWSRRHLNEQGEGPGFESTPEIREVLDAHVEISRDAATAIRAVYGRSFPQLVGLDTRWASRNRTRIFPQEGARRIFWDASWEAYLSGPQVFMDVFSILRGEYHHAVQLIGTASPERRRLGDPDERLAEHLMVMFWHARLELEEPRGLLADFYDRAGDELRAHALGFVGRRLRDGDKLEPEVLDRLKALWSSRLREAQSRESSRSYVKEIAAFGWWFESGRFEDEWSLGNLEDALQFAGTADFDFRVVQRLAELAPAMPKQAVSCLQLMVEGNKEDWGIYGWAEDARSVLETALRSRDADTRDVATELIHGLGARGHFEFRDLLRNG